MFDSNIEIPERHYYVKDEVGGLLRAVGENLESWGVGQSVFVPNRKSAQLSGYLTRWKGRTNYSFQMAKETKDGNTGVRVWRIK